MKQVRKIRLDKDLFEKATKKAQEEGLYFNMTQLINYLINQVLNGKLNLKLNRAKFNYSNEYTSFSFESEKLDSIKDVVNDNNYLSTNDYVVNLLFWSYLG